ncbi:hypothetical protein B0J13DRAFT_568017, partial [Dactylonectria estremocensis]
MHLLHIRSEVPFTPTCSARLSRVRKEQTFASPEKDDQKHVQDASTECCLGSPVTVSSDANTTVTFPSEYSGNFYAVKQGASQEVGMLGEVMFNGWMGLTYFDVSAIVNPGDRDNVKQMWPAKSLVPVSGCQVFPCDNVYYKAND